MKQIHHYDESTGQYLGTSDGFESPLEPGVYLIPAYATDLELPKLNNEFERMFVEGKVLVFADGAWTLVDA
ncbi:hypothetical protein KUF54_07165 [Comamonas sp. Y33R10-2]|uniref:hypothetical protein n=1 Tax=Comamonas sp. Y33R10-2 TaxID=2853257 RepID=UPI001C5CBC72|nr:hypothetical protein [Comamonas sp. Y33R10-2]QXZ10966.1 hypothetical protein KUF54_07165 [Comamonas sp. Y33R10-2]